MTVSMFMKLWLRNMRDAFYSLGDFFLGFGTLWEMHFVFVVPLVLTAIYSVLIFPIYVPFGALFKTIYDVFNKTLINANKIDDKMSEIRVMSHAQVLELESKLVQHNPTTYAEIELNQNLTEQETIKDREFSAGHRNKLRELRLDQLGDNAIKIYSQNYIDEVVLDEAHKNQLKEFDDENKAQLERTLINNDRKILRGFLADEANNGTAATLIIFGLFKVPDAEKVAEKANHLDPIKSL